MIGLQVDGVSLPQRIGSVAWHSKRRAVLNQSTVGERQRENDPAGSWADQRADVIAMVYAT
ncbi:hypothetical protein SAMN05216219_1339 [Mycetocola miduiensis]|uniref:Uncharacterized protein n=1 Tax=Mycetocola miduiensis TaxID=995034 RepID=A0A1I5ACG9_9MICO|nr:hypothetical protein SAMN05216219_1339 [Mycetocola miduiensis]